MKSGIVLFFFCLAFTACKKDPDPVPHAAAPSATSEIEFAFSAVVPGQGKVKRDSVYYDNHLGDRYTVSLFKYYISNVSLVRSDNFVFIEPESYHLISHFEGKESFALKNVPSGNYTKAIFTIGVDSARNVSGAQTGDLDVANKMFWDWDTGYLFYKMEGNYNALSGKKGEYAFHIGGFSGPNKTLEKVQLDLKGTSVDANMLTEVNILADPGAVFNDPVPLSFDTYLVTPPSETRDKAQSANYRDMFSVDNIHVSKK